MDLECNNQDQDCVQTCDAEKCNLTCRGTNCKTQTCGSAVDVYEMDLECNNKDQDCVQTCDAKKCNMTCSEGKYTDCIQKCDGTCNIHRTKPTSSHDKLICIGNSECCGRLMSPSIAWSFTTSIFHIDCGAGKSCNCANCSDSHCITSDSYTSSIVTSIGASTIQVFSTKIPTGHGTESYSEYNNKLNT